MPTIHHYLNSNYIDIVYLLSEVLNLEKTQLYTQSHYALSTQEQAKLNQLIKQRTQGVPLAQITHKKHFYKLEFYINDQVLIPRPETEILVDIALELLSKSSNHLTVLELATGSGAIISNLAHHQPWHYYIATDVSYGVLKVAKQNLQTHHCTQVCLIQTHWFLGITPAQQFDLIIANPPYIAKDDTHLKTLKYEPMNALIADNNGLADLQTIIEQAKLYLKPNGYLLLEHGWTQQASLLKQFNQQNWITNCFNDLNGQNRAILAQIR